jgi:hypothetical protein
MRRFYTVLAAAFVAVSFSSMVFAQAAAPTEKKAPAKTTTQAPVVKKAAAVAATGKVAKYDDATKTLTVTTKTGDQDFVLGTDAKIVTNMKAGTAADLAAGKNVKVTYTEADGKKTATKVNVTTPVEKPAAKTAKK